MHLKKVFILFYLFTASCFFLLIFFLMPSCLVVFLLIFFSCVLNRTFKVIVIICLLVLHAHLRTVLCLLWLPLLYYPVQHAYTCLMGLCTHHLYLYPLLIFIPARNDLPTKFFKHRQWVFLWPPSFPQMINDEGRQVFLFIPWPFSFLHVFFSFFPGLHFSFPFSLFLE